MISSSVSEDNFEDKESQSNHLSDFITKSASGKPVHIENTLSYVVTNDMLYVVYKLLC